MTRLSEKLKQHNVIVVLDASHSSGILPLRPVEWGIDFIISGAYKHLLCPKGCGYTYISPRGMEMLGSPVFGSWFGLDAPRNFYGPQTKELKTTAARYDHSVPWVCYAGMYESLKLLSRLGFGRVARHCVGLATLMAKELGIPSTGSSMVCIPVVKPDIWKRSFEEEGIEVAVRKGGVRFSWHIYNTREDVLRVVGVIKLIRKRTSKL